MWSMRLLRNRALLVFLVVLFLSASAIQARVVKAAAAQGPYLGKRPPGTTPEIFAPGVVSRGYDERSVVFSPRHDELCFEMRVLGFTTVLVYMKHEDGAWTEPETAFFSGTPEFCDGSPFFTADGQKLFFASHRPLSRQEEVRKDSNIWIVPRTDSGWGQPVPAGRPLNSDFDDDYPTLSRSNTLVFFSNRGGNHDIYMSSASENGFSEPQRLESPVNTDDFEGHPFLAADETYLIFISDRPGELGEADLYISFKSADNKWLEPVNMGDEVNSPFHEAAPYVSPDGKYLFFSSFRTGPSLRELRRLSYANITGMLDSPGNGRGDIYWVSAKIIEELRPRQ